MDVVKRLHPKWFDNFATNKSIPLDLKIHKGFVAEENGRIIGFITFASNDGQVKISWMGVDPKFHRKKVGTRLLEATEKKLKSFGLKELRVDTLAESIESKPYEKTRLFYKNRGFRVEKIKKIRSKDTEKHLI